MSQYQNDPIYTLPVLNINGLQISNDATTPNTKLDIAAGTARDSNNVMDICVGASNPNLSGNTVAAPLVINAATNGLLGLDTGSLAASSVYAVFLVADSRYYHATSAILTLASNSQPLMPYGYDSFRLIGYAVTDGSSHFLKMYCSGNGNGRILAFDAPQATSITAGAATSFTAVNLSAFVPAVDNLPVTMAFALTPGAAGRTLALSPYGATGNSVLVTGQVTSVVVSGNAQVLAKLNSGVPSIYYKVSNAGDAAALNVAGFQFFV